METDKAQGKTFKILVVEDNESVLKIIRRALETAGYVVLAATDGKSAVALMADQPDLILQDLILPDISGYDLVAKLRARSEEKPVPILALSGFLAKPDEPWDTDAGFDAFLVKPVSLPELLETVRTWLDK